MFKSTDDKKSAAEDMKKEAKDLAEETFEILDVSKKNGNIIDRLFGDVKKTAPISQVAIGGGTGWVTGYVLIKVGKAAALTILVTGLAVKVAADKGYITINRGAVTDAMEKMQEQAKNMTVDSRRSYSDVIAKIYHNYKYLSIGFSGGFLAAVLF